MLLLVAIFYNVRCTRTMKVQENIQQKKKEPEEHDERFATGRYCWIVYDNIFFNAEGIKVIKK